MCKKLLLLLIIVISIIILFGNFVFFNFLLKKGEDELIQKTGSIGLSKSYIKSDYTDVSLIDIIANTASPLSYGISHQPFENQLSMKEAIQISKSTIIKFVQNGIILDINDIEKRIENEKNYSSSLSTKVDNTIQLNPLYSLWFIKYDDDKLHIYLYLNAVTGDVLRLVVTEEIENSQQNLNVKSQEEILNLYLEYLKLEDLKTDLSVYNELYARCRLKDTNICLDTSYMFDKKNYYLNIGFTNDTQVFDN